MKKERRAVLITGASSGIGFATAKLLAEEGYHVFAGVRSGDAARKLAAFNPNIRTVSLDVTKPEQIDAAIQRVAESGKQLCGLVNNAGIALGGPIEYMPLDLLREQFEINVFAPIALTQAALPLLRDAKGRIIFIGSIAGRLAAPFVGPYSASKSAIAALADSLRLELGDSGVSVSLFEFAAVRTPIWAKGRDSADRLAERMGPAAMERYGVKLESLMKQITHEETHGMNPRTIARAVAATLAANMPRARYVIGRQATMQAMVAALPTGVRDSLVRKALKL